MPTTPKNQRMPWLPPLAASFSRHIRSDFYHSTAWRKLRAAFVAANPLCAECQRHNQTTPGAEVDHIKPINQTDPFDTQNNTFGHPLSWENLQHLCRHHHAKKSAKERKP